MLKCHVICSDVKAQILKRLKEDGVPVAKLAEEYGVPTKTIYGWLSRRAQSTNNRACWLMSSPRSRT